MMKIGGGRKKYFSGFYEKMIAQLYAALRIVCMTSLEQFISVTDHDKKKINSKSTTITDASIQDRKNLLEIST